MQTSPDQPIRVSIVIPVYNGRESLPELLAGIARTMDGRHEYEVIAVNDGSPDDSLDVLRRLAGQHPRLRILDLAKNAGQENAILAGFECVRGEFVVCMDDDLQHDPADIPKLLDALGEKDLDIVFARFVQNAGGSFRRFGTWMNDRMMSFVIGKPAGLVLSSFLAMRRYLARKAGEFQGPYPYLAGQYLSLTSRVGNVDLVQHPRRYRQSNYSLRKLLGVWASGLVNFGLAPLRLMLWLGLALMAVVAVLVVLLIVNRLVYGNLVPLGWTSLTILVLSLASLQMLALGLLGEYLGRVLMTATRYPRFCVRRRYNFADAAAGRGGEGDEAP